MARHFSSFQRHIATICRKRQSGKRKKPPGLHISEVLKHEGALASPLGGLVRQIQHPVSNLVVLREI